MDLKFWWQSFHPAAFLLNRLPSPILNHKSPFELVHGFKPDYSLLKVFRCACYPYLKPYQRHKLSFKTTKCLFIGYCSHHKGYRCLHSSGHIYIARNVAFEEQSFPYSSMFISASSQSQDSPSQPSSFVFPRSLHFSPSSQPLTSSISCSSSPLAVSSPPLLPSPFLSPSAANSVPLLQVPFLSTSISDSSSSSPTVSLPSPISHVPPSLPPNPHPMQTRSKSGIFKPKTYLTHSSPCTEPSSVSEALADSQWHLAMSDEFRALMKNHTWDLVLPSPYYSVIQCKWVFRIKYKVDGSLDKYKARLVAKGFQWQLGVDFYETFSLVVKPSIIRIIFTLAVTRG